MDTLGPRTKNLSAPDDWRWSQHAQPVAGTLSCQFHHVGLVLSGAMDGRMDDGTGFEVRPGDVFDIPPGHDNWVIGTEPMVAVLWGGWRGWGKPPVGDRILTTMLMTDIAGSTDRAAAVGDAAWDQLLERHHALVREVLSRYRGIEIDTAGGIRGLAVHETVRIMALGGAGDILVSGTPPGAVRGFRLQLRGPRGPAPEGNPGAAAGVRAGRPRGMTG